jgi:succinate dehydrogenase / fumarate reductase, membrane anchor subunit
MATTLPRPGGEPVSYVPARAPHQPLQRRPRQNFETWSWFFMRISGLVLVFLALLHFAVTHIINDVIETDAAFVAARWDNPLWRLFDFSLLALAMLHGLNGVRWSIDDYIRSRAGRAAVKAVLYTISGALFVYGTITILTYGT